MINSPIINTFYIKALKSLFIESVERRSTKNFDQAGVLWERIETRFKNSPVSLNVVAKSLLACPDYLKTNEEFGLIVLAHTTQTMVANDYDGSYQFKLFSDAYGFSDRDAVKIKMICLVKNKLIMPRDFPYNFAHDVNFYRLALPFDEFYDNQMRVIKFSHKTLREAKLKQQLKLFTYLLGRPNIFCSPYFVSHYEEDVVRNLHEYIKMEDQILDDLAGITSSSGVSSYAI